MEHQYNNTLLPAVNVSPEPPDIQAKQKSPMREDAKPYKGGRSLIFAGILWW